MIRNMATTEYRTAAPTSVYITNKILKAILNAVMANKRVRLTAKTRCSRLLWSCTHQLSSWAHNAF